MRSRWLLPTALSLTAAMSTAVLTQETIYDVGPGIAPPIAVRQVKAALTAEAKAAGLVGWVSVEIVGRADGMVGATKVVQSCVGKIGPEREPNGDPFPCRSTDQIARETGGPDPSLGLDQAARNAVREWRFHAARKDGQPVAVRMTVVIDYRPQTGK